MSFDLLGFLTQQGLIDRPADHTLTPLRGGYWNQVFRLQGRGLDWVAKLYAARPAHSLFPILPESEASALAALEGQGIAPDFIAYYPARTVKNPGVLLYKYVPGQVWQNGAKPVGTLFRRLHDLPPTLLPLRSLATTPTELLAQAVELLAPVAGTANAQALASRQPARKTVPPLPVRRIVHGDSGTGNLIDTPNGLLLIDWQCPGLGDPCEDWHAFLSPVFQSLYNHPPLDETECAAFRAGYADEATAERYTALFPYLNYRMAAHCCLQAELRRAGDPQASAAYEIAFYIALELL